ncbi:arsenate reductase family protein [Altererythrobacter aquiaggeris]|uniref:arsenate reductase family protein n=1 Tax=Aestuarierythrobacter aquiaggeris TaxID=1898396 RepID=UPI00301B3E15
MKATIWHNPNCSKSRQALTTLEARPDIDLTVVHYLKQPPTAEKLIQLYRDSGMSPAGGLRLAGTRAKESGLTDADDAVIIAAMAADPKLIERPLVETEKGVRLCRPPELIQQIM